MAAYPVLEVYTQIYRSQLEKKMQQRGGRIIGAGSQGCIFSPKLEYTKEGAKVIARRSGNNTKISKVFSNQNVWEGEHTIMQAVRNAVADARTGEVKGVVLYTQEAHPFYTANNLNPENKAELGRRNIGTGCVSLRNINVTKGQKYYVLNQPKIDGDLLDFQDKKGNVTITKRPEYFLDAYNALMKMRIHGLVHMDIASRNIFYNAESAYIGDFGYTINILGDQDQLETSLNIFSRSHGISTDLDTLEPVDAFEKDQLTPEAFVALTIMRNWAHKDVYLRNFERDARTIARRFEDRAHDPVAPGAWRKGYLVINGVQYKKYEDVIKNAKTMDEHTFKQYTFDLLLKSDIKRFIIVITKFLDIPDVRQKYELLDRVLNHNDFNFFYTVFGFEIPDFAAAAAPGSVTGGSGSGAAAAGGGGGGGGTNFLIHEMPASRAAPAAMGGAGGAPNYGARAAAAAPSAAAVAPQTYENVNLNEMLYDVQWDSLSKSKTPKEFETHLSNLSPASIENVIKMIRSNDENKVNIAKKIDELLTYYQSNGLQMPKMVVMNLEIIFDSLNSSGGGRRRSTIARPRRLAQKTRKHKRV